MNLNLNNIYEFLLNENANMSTFYGPTDTSNWLIPDLVLMSAYPGDVLKNKAKEKIINLLDAGINTFICLQTEKELNRFVPYKPIIEQYIKDHNMNPNDIEYIHFPIPDNYVASDDLVKNLIKKLIYKIKNNNKKLLIHCWGGHGRTGTISAILLSYLYEISAEESLKIVEIVHRCRKMAKSCAPQTYIQFEQVRRLSFDVIRTHIN